MVELLCVIAIVSLLLAILLPAVQAAREASRHSVCQSNTRNFALAIVQRNDVSKRLPENRFRFDSHENCLAESLWFEQVRPYLELPEFKAEPGEYGAYSILSCPSSPGRYFSSLSLLD